MKQEKPKKLKSILPTKPSALLRLALEDLEAVEADKKYKVAMGKWHEPNGACKVCLAGSVLAKTLQVPRNLDLSYDYDDENEVFGARMIDPEGWNRHVAVATPKDSILLMKLNSMREGDMEAVLDRVLFSDSSGGIMGESNLFFNVEEQYSLGWLSTSDLPEWRLHMLDLIGILETYRQ